MKAPVSCIDKTLRKAISISLVIAAYSGVATLDSEVQAADETMSRSVEGIRTAAVQGDTEAMYWLAMMHIEGSIAGADYDRGVELLKASANLGNKDAERMYSFMDNAFSGEGC